MIASTVAASAAARTGGGVFRALSRIRLATARSVWVTVYLSSGFGVVWCAGPGMGFPADVRWGTGPDARR
ncbi:hypothetical protein GCM10023223_51910 [Stackebrandtia albiflava]